MRMLVSTFFFFLSLQAPAQTLANGQFNVLYSSTGIAGLKHLHDSYDTDYIGAGKTLGDVLSHLRGLPAGVYHVMAAGKPMPNIDSRHGEPQETTLPVRSTTVRVTISRNQERTSQ